MGVQLGHRPMRCQSCGAQAPTRYVDFRQNVGMLVIRRRKTVAGQLCKPCIHRHFWTMTGTTVAVGWLGQISMFIAPVFVVNNVIRYVSVLGMPGQAGGKKLTKAAAEDALPTMAWTPPPRIADAGPLPFDDAPGAEPIELLPVDAAEILRPHWAAMVGRIKAKEALDAVAADVAAQTGLTPAEVADYVRDRVRRAKAAKAAKAAVPV